MKTKSLLTIIFVASLLVACNKNDEDPSNDSVNLSTMPDDKECYYYTNGEEFYSYMFFCYSRTLGSNFDEALKAFQDEHVSQIGKTEYNTVLDTLKVKDGKSGVVYIHPYFTEKSNKEKILFYPEQAIDTEGKCYLMTTLPD
ncbi:MAG: hypothetical protein IJ834_01895 [Paludibacteraceae bacterium]|nr:hypothetical protein [Paludibacteraceae bacterium]